jgi:hypothetical protein
VVKIEKDREKKCERNSKEDISNTDIPETDQPGTIKCGEESFASRKGSNIHVFHLTDVDEASEEDDGQRSAIVLEEFSNESPEQIAVPQFTTNPCSHENKKRNHDAQIGRGFSYRAPLSGENLNALLEIDASNIEPEDVTRKPRNVLKTVAGISYGQNPMHN